MGNQNERLGGNLAGEHLQSLSLRSMELRSMTSHCEILRSMNSRRMNSRNLNESRAMLHVVNRSGVASMLRRASLHQLYFVKPV